MNWKQTLDLPYTNFPMRANLVSEQSKWKKFWYDHQIHERLIADNKGNKFIVKDGPPYANGNIHLGHVLNKVLKDFIVRMKSMQGYKCEFVPGWDGHGLPIENAQEKIHKTNDPIEKRALCRKFAIEQMLAQKAQLQQMNLFANFQQTYFTIDHNYQIRQLEVFLKLFKKGYIDWAKKPVAWSISSQTALSESEIVYKKKESNSIFFVFPSEDLNIVIWTTTPYTLEANLALSVNPTMKYGVVEYLNTKYLMAHDLVDGLIEKFGWIGAKVVDILLGKDLEGRAYSNTITKEELNICIADYVDLSGSGIVHNAPGFGDEDYEVGKKYGLDIYSALNGLGIFIDSKFAPINNMFYEDASIEIIKHLQKIGGLIIEETIIHDVGHDWRTGKVLFYKALDQWFISLKGLKKAGTFISTPDWLKNKLLELIQERKEWCLSRQRVWGVPIPIQFNDGLPNVDITNIENNIQLLKEKGVDHWFTLPNSSKDIMDVWFDSGTSFLNEEKYQADIYIEGSDQMRGWFNSSSILSLLMNDQFPFKHLIAHGFVLKDGEKMSKSKGNVIDPMKLLKTYGDDVIRLWIACSDYRVDICYSSESMNNTVSLYKKIRNNLFKWSLSVLKNHPIINSEIQEEANKYIFCYFWQQLKLSVKDVENYQFYSGVHRMINFITFYSAWYLEICKDTVYCGGENKNECLFVIHNILINSVKFFSIFLPQTCEECYSHINTKSKQSIFFEKYQFLPPQTPEISAADWDEWVLFFKIKDQIIFNLKGNKNSYKLISPFSNKYMHYLSFGGYEHGENISFEKIEGAECKRCRLINYSQDISLCNRCQRQINHI